MPPRHAETSIAADALRSVRSKGGASPLLDARLEYTEVEGVSRYVRMMRGVESVQPTMLPTQASGRWSTTDPPLVTFPHDCINPRCGIVGPHIAESETCWSAQELVGPTYGWWWLKVDLDAIEGKIAAAEAGDEDELTAFEKGWDIHTLTACGMFNKPRPPILTKALHRDPSCQAWRELWDPPWSGSEDRRRHIAKVERYATQFCRNPRGVLQAQGIEKLGLTPAEVVRFAESFLASKPKLMARKRQVWADSIRLRVAYTWYGRRRRLYGSEDDIAKTGWSHRVSGTVTDMMNEFAIWLDRAFPESHLVLNGHDSLTWAFPSGHEPAAVVARAGPALERRREGPNGYGFTSTGSWSWIDQEVRKRAL